MTWWNNCMGLWNLKIWDVYDILNLSIKFNYDIATYLYAFNAIDTLGLLKTVISFIH